MLQCCFLGYSENFEIGSRLADKLDEELKQLIALQDEIEFWFTNVNDAFLETCFGCALRLKREYPEHPIRIVQVIDPVREERNDKVFEANPADKTVPAPVMDEEMMQPENIYECRDFIRHSKKIHRWVVSQCNYVFAYHYPVFPNRSQGQLIKSAMKQKDTTLIPIRFTDTEDFIPEQINCVKDERRRTMLKMLSEGVPVKEIGQKFGVSGNRVAYLASQAEFEVRTALRRRRYIYQNKGDGM